MNDQNSKLSFPERLILWNVFLRNFVVTFSTIYMSAEFLVNVGKKDWPLVFQFTQYFSLSFILISVFLNRKKFYRFHNVMLLLFLAALGMYYSFPASKGVVIFLTVMVFVVDLIGDITSTNALMGVLSSIRYKFLSPKIVLYNACASVIGSLMVIVTQKYGNQLVFLSLALFGALGHFFTYTKITLISLKGQKKKQGYRESAIEKVVETSRFTFSNPLILLAFALLVWTTLVKFCSDWVYVSSAATVFTSSEDLSTFLSIASLGLMGVVIFFQQFVTPRIIKKYSPALLLTIIPVVILLSGVIGVMFNSAYIGIVFNLLFLTIAKTLHDPTLKVCMQSIHEKKKPRVFLLLNFCISGGMLLLTGVMSIYRDVITVKGMYYILALLSIVAVMVVMKFDRYYLKNLWETLKKEDDQPDDEVAKKALEESIAPYFNPYNYYIGEKSEHVSEDVFSTVDVIKYFCREDSSAELLEAFNDSDRTPFEKMILVSNTYLFTKNISTFKEAMICHKKMYQSQDLKVKERAMELFILIGTDDFRKLLSKEKDHSIQSMLKVHEFFELDKVKGDTYKNSLKIFSQISWSFLTPKNQEKLRKIFKIEKSNDLKMLSSWLSRKSLSQVKHDILRSFDLNRNWVDAVVFLNRYLSEDLKKRRQMQRVLFELEVSREDRKLINPEIEKIMATKESFSKRSELLDLLYIVEWANVAQEDYFFTLKSFDDFDSLSVKEKEHWLDFHDEILKKLDQVKMREFLKTNQTLLL